MRLCRDSTDEDLPPCEGLEHLTPRTRPLAVQRIARLRVFIVGVGLGGNDFHVRHLVASAASAMPVSELVRNQLGARLWAQSTAPCRFRVVAKPVKRPVQVRTAAFAFRALHLRRFFVARPHQNQPLTYIFIYKMWTCTNILNTKYIIRIERTVNKDQLDIKFVLVVCYKRFY